MSNNWEMVIGLEVHAQLKTSSKLFSSSPNQFGSEPNENVNFIDSGMPGMLPVMNFGCIEMAIKTGYALNFKINNRVTKAAEELLDSRYAQQVKRRALANSSLLNASA